MEDINFIEKNTEYPDIQNYEVLRDAGLSMIETIAGKVWNDFNAHDPGITMLEVLSFALTDLGFRVDKEITELIATDPEDLTDTFENSFHTAAEVLPACPLSITDYRKLLIDVDGVRNAFIFPLAELPADEQFDVDYANSILSTTGLTNNDIHRTVTTLGGMWGAIVDFETEVNNVNKENQVLAAATARIHANRNVGEDIISVVRPTGTEQIEITGGLEVKSGADPNKVLAEALYRIENHISPSARFYSLRQMYDKGYETDQIFEGPLLDNGFLISEEIDAIQKPEHLYASDLIRILMQIDGVEAVYNLTMTSSNNPTSDCSDVLPLMEERDWAVEFDVDNSNILLQSGTITVATDATKVANLLRGHRLNELRYKNALTSEDLPIPTDAYSELADYRPVQNELPEAYGVGLAGLPAEATDDRIAQARQLKAYLLFFEQMLANYFQQLANARHLLSWKTDTERTTYFYQAIQGMDGLFDLYDSAPGSMQEVEDLLETLKDAPSVYTDRKNRFLDHLMGRFNEQITDYSLLLFDRFDTDEKDRQVTYKELFLKDYPEISSGRYKSFDYTATRSTNSGGTEPDVWDTENVGGYSKRISRLLGIPITRRRYLFARYDVSIEESTTANQYLWRWNVDRNGVQVSISPTATVADHDTARDNFKALAGSLSLGTDDDGTNYWVTATGGGISARSQNFPDATAQAAALAAINAEIADNDGISSEGFHIVEHLMLRPREGETDVMVIAPDNASREYLEEHLSGDIPDFLQQFSDYSETRANVAATTPETDDYIIWDATLPTQAFPNAARVCRVRRALSGVSNFDTKFEELSTKLENYSIEVDGGGTVRIRIRDENNAILASQVATGHPRGANELVAQMLLYFSWKFEKWDWRSLSKGEEDPYSHQLTVVMPAWSRRNQNYFFRRRTQELIRMEAPAHCSVRVVYIDETAMEQFEICYQDFLTQVNEVANGESGATLSALGCVVTELGEMQDVYLPYYDVEPARGEDTYNTVYEIVARLVDTDVPVASLSPTVGGAAATATTKIQFPQSGGSFLEFCYIAGEANDGTPVSGLEIGDIYLANNPIDIAGDGTGPFRYAQKGTYTRTVYSTTTNGDITEHEVTIVINPDTEAEYDPYPMNPFRFRECIDSGTILFRATDADLPAPGYLSTVRLIPDNAATDLLALGLKVVGDPDPVNAPYEAGDIITTGAFASGGSWDQSAVSHISILLGSAGGGYSTVSFPVLTPEDLPTDPIVWDAGPKVLETAITDSNILASLQAELGNVSTDILSITEASATSLATFGLEIDIDTDTEATIRLIAGQLATFRAALAAGHPEVTLTNAGAGAPYSQCYTLSFDLDVTFEAADCNPMATTCTFQVYKDQPIVLTYKDYDPAVGVPCFGHIAQYPNNTHLVWLEDLDVGVDTFTMSGTATGSVTISDKNELETLYGIRADKSNNRIRLRVLDHALLTTKVNAVGTLDINLLFDVTDNEGTAETDIPVDFQFRADTNPTWTMPTPNKPVHGYTPGLNPVIQLLDPTDGGIKASRFVTTAGNEFYEDGTGKQIHWSGLMLDPATPSVVLVATGYLNYVPSMGDSTSMYGRTILEQIYGAGTGITKYNELSTALGVTGPVTYNNIFQDSKDFSNPYRRPISRHEQWLEFAPRAPFDVTIRVTDNCDGEYDLTISNLTIPNATESGFTFSFGTGIQQVWGGQPNAAKRSSLESQFGLEVGSLTSVPFTRLNIVNGIYTPKVFAAAGYAGTGSDGRIIGNASIENKDYPDPAQNPFTIGPYNGEISINP